MMLDNVFREDEKAIYKLRELYSNHGYNQYKVSKFEEYDLYARNKSFLVSENLLTFTDTNGKLMALKPDITLSIIKNAVADDKSSYKLYYDEHVYRTTSGGDGFREIMQTGLESIGAVDIFSESEVIMLAAKSLASISEDYLLDLSHMSFIEGMLENIGIEPQDMAKTMTMMGSKNVPALRSFCDSKGISESDREMICGLTSMYLPMGAALEKIKPTAKGTKMSEAYEELCDIYKALKCYGITDKIRLDLSIVNDMNYYDGVIFKGFINKIPDSILSGGRYDRLMEKFGKKTGAIGFAVYLDKLERFGNESREYDIDVMLVYDNGVDPELVISTVDSLMMSGKTVRAVSAPDGGVRCRQLMKLTKEGVDILEGND